MTGSSCQTQRTENGPSRSIEVEPISIDDAFLDLGGTELLHRKPPALVLAEFARRIERDLLTGRVSLVIEDQGPENENLDHGLVTRETMGERWSVHPADPASATSEIRWTQALSRGGLLSGVDP